MSKIKELRNNPKYNINIVDFLCNIFPNNETKYVETFLRIFDNLPAVNGEVESTYTGIMKTFSNDFKIPMDKEFKTKGFHLVLYQYIIDRFINKSNIQEYLTFIENSERNLLTNKDLSTYKKFSQVINENKKVQEKLAERELESQTIKIHDDDEWLILKPLSFESSKKYGANTTWCTTMKDYPEHFEDYSGNGILIYCVNKKNNQKTIAIHYNINKKELSFWDVEDRRIDSMQSSLNFELLYEIMDNINNNMATNKYLHQVMKKEKNVKTQEDLRKTKNQIVPPGVSVVEHDQTLLGENILDDSIINNLLIDTVEFNPTRNLFKYFNNSGDMVKLNALLSHLVNNVNG